MKTVDSLYAQEKFNSDKRNALEFIKTGQPKLGNDGVYEDFPLDPGILPMLRQINKNQKVATLSSCSGLHHTKYRTMENKFIQHGGHPHILVSFPNRSTEAYYVNKIKEAGYTVRKLDSDILIETGSKNVSEQEAKRFWKTVTRILSGG